MKKLIIALMVLPSLAFASVEIHENEFSLDSATEGSHFWARLYDWNAWAETDKQQSIQLHTNFVQQAYENGHEEADVNSLSQDDFISLMGDDEGEALYEFYEMRQEQSEDDPIDASKIGDKSGLVTAVKVAVDLPDNFDIGSSDLDSMHHLIARADEPHIHKEISQDFVNRFVDPLHSARNSTVENTSKKIVLTTVNVGSDYYSCFTMNQALKLYSAATDGISAYFGDFRIYTINSIEEVNLSESYLGQNLIEGSPAKVFKQEMIYSSTIIKSGVNYYALYNLPNGKKKMVLNSVTVSTDQIIEYSQEGNFVNGISESGERSSEISFENGQAVLSSDNLDLSPLSGNCSKGLAQGMGRYVLGLAERVAR